MPNSHPFVMLTEKDTVNNILYVGGDFQQINDLKTKGIVKYDGVKFDTLGAGFDPQWAGLFTASQPRAMKMFQNKLYVTGDFEKAGKYYSSHIARWNGADWDTVNFRMKSGNNYGYSRYLDVYNNELYIGGDFDSIGGVKTNNFAKFDGTNWHGLSYPYNTCVVGMANYKGKLYMAGEVTSGSSCANLAYYDGVSWNPWAGIYGSTTKTVFGMKVIDSMLFVYGRFYSIGGANCSGLAAWNGTKWFGYGKGVEKVGTIFDINKVNGDLYISGIFDSINELSTGQGVLNYYTNIAKFDNTNKEWCTFMPPIGGGVAFIAEYNHELYFGGGYLNIGSSPAMPFTKWTGGSTSVNCSAFVDVGINEHTGDLHFSLYPNPTTDVLHFVDEERILQEANIEIRNTIGQLVLMSNFKGEIDVSGLPPGIYLLTLKNGVSSKAVKFVKQ
jgi:hypothetical protein